MSLISDLVPLNLDQEKDKVKLNNNYNPQFIYERDFSASILNRFGLPREEYLQLAQNYLARFPIITKIKSDFLTKPQTILYLKKFFESYNLESLPIIFKNNSLARASLKSKALIIRAQSELNVSSFRSILAHEIETHYFRFYNQKLQSFTKQKPSDYLRTEEGLAILNSNFYKNKPDFTFTCRKYLGVASAQAQSFSQIFNRELKQSNNNFEQAWNFTLRLKRGLLDTSQAGGFTKDLVYLEGLVEACNWLSNSQNSLIDLYLGKVSFSQIPKIKALAITNNLLYPHFTEHLDQYLTFVDSCKQLLGLLPL